MVLIKFDIISRRIYELKRLELCEIDWNFDKTWNRLYVNFYILWKECDIYVARLFN